MRVPAGVRTITWSTAIRFTGWGLIEALLPIFMYRFTGSYIETALISGAFYFFFLLTIPLAGVIADRISARGMLLTSMAIYVFIGASYFLAGWTGLIACIILARALNGIAFSLDVVARYTYLRRHVEKKRIGRTFGYMTAVSNFWWTVALVASLAVVTLVELHYLFLAISVTALASWLLLYKKLPRDREHQDIRGMQVVAAYKDMYHRMRQRGVGLWTLAFFAFSTGVLGTISTFFIPLYVYAHGESLRQVVFVTGLVALPLVFARPIGALVDKLQQKAVFIGYSGVIVLLVVFPFVPYIAQLVLAFLIAMFLELLVLALATIVTHRVKPERYGRVESVMQVSSNVGIIIGAFVIGLFTQKVGGDKAFIFLAAVAIASLAALYWRRKYLLPIVHPPVKH